MFCLWLAGLKWLLLHFSLLSAICWAALTQGIFLKVAFYFEVQHHIIFVDLRICPWDILRLYSRDPSYEHTLFRSNRWLHAKSFSPQGHRWHPNNAFLRRFYFWCKHSLLLYYLNFSLHLSDLVFNWVDWLFFSSSLDDKWAQGLFGWC